MDDYSWSNCTDHHEMVIAMPQNISSRKMKLFVANMYLLTYTDETRKLIKSITEAMFDFIEGRIKEKEYITHLQAYNTYTAYNNRVAIDRTFWDILFENGWSCYTRFNNNFRSRRWNQVITNVMDRKIIKIGPDILRHIIRNPFKPELIRPTGVDAFTMAKALSEGEDCDFALADALREETCDELADHFMTRQETHCQGCWALDTILGKD